ncbi:GTP cyclohydrolase II RibA, partial [uncultured Chryseobacterium sp.]
MLKIQAQSKIPTDYGLFTVYAFSENEEDWSPHLVLVMENTDFNKTVNVRFHSECITGEVFHSKKCECGQQLDAAMKYMSENGGLIIYLRQEGRNIGIINKLRAYALQEQGMDTVEANLKLGLPADARNFDVAVEMLNLLNVRKINLLTNNPDKIKS